jgi:uncharacterized RDD family membrane protein YckC
MFEKTYKTMLLLILMNEGAEAALNEQKTAGILLRVVAKFVDLIIIVAIAEVLPKAGYLAGVGYMLIGDGFFKGKSVGKRLVGITVVSKASGMPASMRESILRNMILSLAILFIKIPFIGWIIAAAVFAFEFIFLIGSKEGMRLGDEIAKTAVVEAPEAHGGL